MGTAIRTTCYLIILSLFVSLNDDVSKRVWIGKDVSYSHLRVFGCKAMPKEQWSKLGDKAIPYIFLGYGSNEFWYRL